MPIDARVGYCPTCSPIQRLIRKDISPTHAIKACLKCKRKFTFIRTDTPQGKALRTKLWRETKAPKTEVPDAEGIVLDDFKEFTE